MFRSRNHSLISPEEQAMQTGCESSNVTSLCMCMYLNPFTVFSFPLPQSSCYYESVLTQTVLRITGARSHVPDGYHLF